MRKTISLLILLQSITIFITVPSPLAQDVVPSITISPTLDGTITQNTITDLSTTKTYANIQDAIQHAAKGSTIQLSAGTYQEIITIDKPLTIIGDGAENTFITPTSTTNSYAIRISASDVTIQGVHVTNNGPGLYTTGIKVTGSRTTIDHCVITDTPVGIALWSSHNTITECYFSGCDDEGIVLLGIPTQLCMDNTIIGCDFRQNCDGIEIQCSSNTHIQDCVFTKNTHAGIDIIQQANENTLISGCKFSSNGAFGVYISQSTHTQITACSFEGNPVTISGSPDTTITDCQLETIYLFDESSLTIQDCPDFDASAINSLYSTYTIEHEEPVQDTILSDSMKNKNTLLNKISTLISQLKTILLVLRNRS